MSRPRLYRIGGPLRVRYLTACVADYQNAVIIADLNSKSGIEEAWICVKIIKRPGNQQRVQAAS